jgi:hypothetical protein
MKPGDMVQTIGWVTLYDDRNQPIDETQNLTGIILEWDRERPPWIKWLVCDGRIGWSNSHFLEIINGTR